MFERIKLLLLIPHLGGGGAEKVTAQLAERLDPDRFELHLALIAEDSPGAHPERLPRWVNVYRFRLKRVRHAWLRLIQLIRQIRPHAILSNMAHLNFLLLAIKLCLPANSRLLIRQNTLASAASASLWTRLAYRFLYPSADAILCQSQAMADDLAVHFQIKHHKIVILPNPIDLTFARQLPLSPHPLGWSEKTWPRLVSIGRLAPEKGYDLLLHAIARIRQELPLTRLAVLGAGPEEARLRNLSHELKIADILDLPGYVQDISPWFAHATAFVLSSHFEGTPNALLEAAAAGLPLVATACGGGVGDLLQNQPGVWMAPKTTASSLAETLLDALPHLNDPPRRFHHAFLDPFEAGAAIAAYQSCIEGLVSRGRGPGKS